MILSVVLLLPALLALPAFWGAITGALGLGAVVVGAASHASAAQTQCEKDCKDTCKAETGWLLSGRQKCIKQCKADCATQNGSPPPAQESSINWWYVSAGILLIITVVLYVVFRKK